MKEKDIQQHFEDCLQELPAWIRNSGVAALEDILEKKVVDEIKEAYEKDPKTWWAMYHHGWGTSIRNYLRDTVCSDAGLPSQNWDDYYIQIVEIYCGVRKYEPKS